MEVDWRQVILGALIEVPIWRFFDFLISYTLSLPFALLPSLSASNLVSLAVSLLIVILTLVAINARRSPIVGVAAYLFFPQGTSDQDMTLKFSEDHHYRRTIVNFKTSPPAAYYLPAGSYAWKLVKKRPDLWVSELDQEPNNPNYVKAWCEKRGYNLTPRAPRREDLLDALNYNLGTELDHRLDHVEYRYFYPLWSRFSEENRIPSRRSILNWATMKAFALDWWTLKLATTGKIRGASVIWVPMPHYVQTWARSHGFEWSDRLPTMEDLLAKGGQ